MTRFKINITAIMQRRFLSMIAMSLCYIFLCACVRSDAPLLTAENSDDVFPAHFTMESIDPKSGTLKDAANVSADHHEYVFKALVQPPTAHSLSGASSAGALGVLPPSGSLYLKWIDQTYFLIQVATVGSAGYEYYVGKYSSPNRVVASEIDPTDTDINRFDLNKTKRDQYYYLSDPEQLMTVARDYVNGAQSISWTPLFVLKPYLLGVVPDNRASRATCAGIIGLIGLTVIGWWWVLKAKSSRRIDPAGT